ncbi:hypothetical protein R5R35_005786 [Gryllus longicercus]|uniref:Sulfhydryl oxidase n=2 Tax=Gryllus longicercus TaxID=2509291 RepID=A0AAN9W0W0_9ORTH
MATEKDSYRGTAEKPCRACTDFQSWTKLQKRSLNKENVSNEKKVEVEVEDKPCPLSKDQLGNHTWHFLHTMAAYYPEKPSTEQKAEMKQFFSIFSNFYPCNYCAEDLKNQLKESPPKTDSQKELSQWLCRVHNNINRRLGKKEFDCSKVDERWKTGWKDGSCD